MSGSLAAIGLTVDVFDLTTNTDLGNAVVIGESFSIALDLPAGTNQLRATAEDAAQNLSAPAFFTAFIDLTPPMVSAIAAVSPNVRNTGVDSIEITFNKPINSATFTTADLSLTDNGGPNLITPGVTIVPVSTRRSRSTA